MRRTAKIITLLLGLSLFSFGVLKFVDPFKSWYTTQITNSGLNMFFYWLGQLGEISVGLLYFFLLVYHKKISKSNFKWLMKFANLTVIIMMLFAVYVHMHPNVPADILPLKISHPYLPGFLVVLSGWNMFLNSLKKYYTAHA